MSFELVAQQAIFTALDGQVGATVYDYVPDLPSGQPAANFPYVVIGNDTFVAWDTDDQLGAEVTITLHVWSRQKTMLEAKTIAGAIYAKLHRATFLIAGYRTIDCLCEFSEFLNDPDNRTRHGVLRYRLTLQKE